MQPQKWALAHLMLYSAWTGIAPLEQADRQMRKSLAICGVTYIIFAAVVLLMDTGALRNASVVINVLFYPFGVFTILSGFFAAAAIVIGALEFKTQGPNVASLTAILAGTLFVIGYIFAIKHLWPALMGV